MTSAAATNESAPAAGPRRSMAFVLAVVAAACASPPEVYSPGDLTPEQRAQCRACAQAFLDQSEDYPQLRDALREDPIAARWFVRYLETHVVKLREGQAVVLSDESVRLDQIRKERGDPIPWNVPGQRPDQQAIGQIVEMGELAIDVVVNDLLIKNQEFLRAIAREVLAGIGDPAVPAVLELARSGDVRLQNIAARTLGAIGAEGPALAALRELAASPDWQVRSSVALGLSSGGESARALLIELLRDEDLFVRRKAAEAIAAFGDAASADALADYLERSKRDEDFDGERAAQIALQVMAGTRGPRSVEAWRAFAAELRAGAGGAGEGDGR